MVKYAYDGMGEKPGQETVTVSLHDLAGRHAVGIAVTK